MNKKKKLKCGIIGAGINSEIGKIHLSSILIDNLWEITAASFSQNKQINYLTAQYYNLNNTKIYQDYKKLISENKNILDVIIIVTPTFDHYKIINHLSKFNIPIISEKPLVSSLKEIDLLKRKIDNKKILTVYNYSCYPAIKNIKEEISKGSIGKINKILLDYNLDSFINSNSRPRKWRLKDKKVPTILLDLGCHIFQMIYFLTDLKPLSVVSSFNSLGVYKKLIDNCSCLFKIGNKIEGIISISKTDVGNKNGLSFKIIGDKGSVEWSNTTPENYILSKLNQKILVDRSHFNKKIQNRYSRFKPGHPEGFLEGFANMYRDFYEIIKSKKMNKHSKYFDFKLSYHCQQFLNCISISFKSKKWVKIIYK